MQPLVEPAPTLTPAERARYSRHTVMAEVGEGGQRRLKNARVLCIGAGGLGSPTLLYLAAAGVGTIGVIDDDVVSVSNLQRQVLYTESDIGLPKVSVARARLTALNPLIDVVEHHERLTADNAAAIVGSYDLVIDGADNFSTRFLVNDTCAALGIPDVMGSVLQFSGQISVFWAGVGPCYRCVFPDAPHSAPACADAGVFGALCGTVGGWLATEAIKLITGVGEPLVGRLLVFDAAAMNTHILNATRDPDCPVCAAAPERAVNVTTLMPQHSVAEVSVDDVVSAISLRAGAGVRPDFRLIDIREASELLQFAVPQAEHIPMADLIAAAQTSQLHPAEPLVLFCHAGVRSAATARVLMDLGITHVSHIPDGIAGWQRLLQR